MGVAAWLHGGVAARMGGGPHFLVALLGSLLRSASAQECPENSTGLGNGQICRCNDGFTGPLTDAEDPTSGAAQLAYITGQYRGPCSRE